MLLDELELRELKLGEVLVLLLEPLELLPLDATSPRRLSSL